MNSLAGVRVIDLSRLLPGPYATQLLADMGAEVIKLERPPDGDYARAMPPYIALDEERSEGFVFAQNNRGKKSVALDFDSPEGRETLVRLCKGADVLVESFRPGTLARRKLGWAELHAECPRLIYCSVSGYGQTGPLAERAGHDINYLALAGILKLNGARTSAPVPMPVLVADLAGGMRAAFEIVAALVERERTGMGSYLDVALFDAAVDWMQTITGAAFRAEGVNPSRSETFLTGLAPCYNVYETSDGGFMSIGALEPRFWIEFCSAVGREDLVEQQFDEGAVPRVRELFKTRTREEWTEFSKRVDCCLDPLLDVSETFAHPQVAARGLIQTEGRVPRMGEDTERVLRDED